MIKMNLSYLLDKNKLTQKELSESTGISKNTINRYYNDTWTTVNKEHLNSICKYFKCSISDLLEFTNDNQPINNNNPLNICLEEILDDFDNNIQNESDIKKQYYNLINKNMGKLTIDQIQKYAMMLSQEPDNVLSYADVVHMVTKINNQYKK